MTAQAHFDGRDWPWPASRIGARVELVCVVCLSRQGFTISELVDRHGWVCWADHDPCRGQLMQRYDFTEPGCPAPLGNEENDRINRELVAVWTRDLEHPRTRVYGRRQLARVKAGAEPRTIVGERGGA